MRKFIHFCLFVIALSCVISACSSDDKSPGEEVTKYIGYIQAGDYEKFGDIISFDKKFSSDEVKQKKELIIAALKQKYEKNGGIKDIQLISEVKSQNGKNAKVIAIQYYEDGTNESSSYDMVKARGSWKIKFE